MAPAWLLMESMDFEHGGIRNWRQSLPRLVQDDAADWDGQDVLEDLGYGGRRCNGDSRGSSKFMMIMNTITESRKVPGEGPAVMRQSARAKRGAGRRAARNREGNRTGQVAFYPCRKRRAGYYQVPRGTKQAA